MAAALRFAGPVARLVIRLSASERDPLFDLIEQWVIFYQATQQ